MEKVTGTAVYAGDMTMPGQAWLKTVFAGVPHARVTALDVRSPGRARRDRGAHRSGRAGERVRPHRAGPAGALRPGSTAQAAVVRWEADRIALVVAETPAQAEAAAKLIHVEYEELPLVTDPLAAMQPGAPVLHPNPFPYPYGDGTRDLSSNVLLAYKAARRRRRRRLRPGRRHRRGHLSHACAGARTCSRKPVSPTCATTGAWR
ncbi:MAG: hypothetical protein R2838_06095 [Caldilineaceae bacterium]